MPQLPTLTVTDSQQARILAAMKDRYGKTDTQGTIDSYLDELAGLIKTVVFEYERKAIIEQAAQAQADLQEQINNSAV